MPFPTMPNPAADRDRDDARPERETLLLAAAGAAQVLGHDHGVTMALARASITMAPADLWKATLAVKTLLRKRLYEVTKALGPAASRSD